MQRFLFLGYLALGLVVVSGCGHSKSTKPLVALQPCPAFTTTEPEPKWSELPPCQPESLAPTNQTDTEISPPVLVVSSTIDVNNPATWPRVTFKELGFSVKLPFEKTTISSGLTECRDGNLYRAGEETPGACTDKKHAFAFRGDATDQSGARFFVGSYSKYFSIDAAEWTPALMYDFHQAGTKYLYGHDGLTGFEMHPLKTINTHGHLIVLFDQNKDFFDLQADFPKDPGDTSALYGIAIKLPGNKMFDATIISYYKPDATSALQEAKNIANSIIFF